MQSPAKTYRRSKDRRKKVRRYLRRPRKGKIQDEARTSESIKEGRFLNRPLNQRPLQDGRMNNEAIEAIALKLGRRLQIAAP